MNYNRPITQFRLIMLVAMLLMIVTTPLVQAAVPGGISGNLQLWLKANTGISQSDGQTLKNWTDQSTNAYTASNTAGDGQTSPTFRNNISDNINFNPVVEFDGAANGVDLGSDYIYSSNNGLTFFAVVKPDAEQNEDNYIFDFGRVGNTGYGFVYANDAFQIYTPIDYGGKMSGPVTHSYSTNSIIYTGKIDFGTEQRIYLNGTSIYNDTITLTQLTSNEIVEGPTHLGCLDGPGPVTIGRQSKVLCGNDRLFDGKIAEVILYNADLSDTNRNKVQSYLAIKYGITLDSSIDYLNSSSTTIYPSTSTHSGYTNDIAGIGTDNGSNLTQPKSRNVNSDSIITITGSGIADGHFLIWGNDDGALTFSSTEVPSGKRLVREWKIAETSEVGNVTISFDLSNVAGADLSDATQFGLLIDADGNFSDATTTTGATINGNVVDFSAVDLNEGQYFSLVYNNAPIAGFGTALDFDGVDDYIQLLNLLTIGSSDHTVEMWVKVPVVGNGGLSNGERVGILLGNFNNAPDANWELTSNGALRACWNTGHPDVVATTDLRDGQWHHIAFVRDKTVGKFYLYIDGVSEHEESSAGSDIVFSAFHRIGGDNRTSPPYFHGVIDDMRVWDIARSQIQIQDNIYNTLQGNESGLVGYWPFDENAGTTASDKTANNNNGTLTNGPTWGNSDVLSFTTNESTPFVFSNTLPAVDADSDLLTYILVDDDGGAAVLDNASTGAFTYTPTTSGTRTFTYKVNDGTTDSNIVTVTVTVTSLVVDNTGDTDDGDYSPGQNTLREAIANASSGDTITFDPSIAGQTITLTNQLTIDKDLTIDGSGQNITVSGNNSVRVFEVTAGTVNFNSLTMSNGNTSGSPGKHGGNMLIQTGTTVTINNSTFLNGFTWGGGIGEGGAILNIGTLIINKCTFSGNRAVSSGAIKNNGSSVISNSTFYNNSANGFDGGAIRNANAATLTVDNSTFYANKANRNGGAIKNHSGATLHLRNSILANSPKGGDCFNEGNITTNTNNLIEDGSCSPALIGDPNLGSLQDNGGITQTMALLPGSPAINAGDNATCEANDQRGEIRPKHTTCDIGAYEYELKAPTNLSGSTASQTQITLSWTDNSNDETGFKIERNGVLITTTAADAIGYSDSGLSCGTIYNYSVKATNANGDSTAATASVKTQTCPSIYHKLTVNKIGNGTITASYGINCGNDCEHEFLSQSEMTLTATPEANWIFEGWTGDCNSNGTVTIDSDKSCTATFRQQHSLTITVEGQGNVDDCGTGCTQNHLNGETINLTTTSEGDWLLANWGGDCDKNGTVTMDSDKSCTATFIEGYPLNIDVVTGKGKVTTATQECQENCQEVMALDATTTLIAEPEIEWVLEGWSGDCDDQGHVEMSSEKTCIANFIPDPNIPNEGDGNDDGFQDVDQPHVVSMPDSVSGEYITITVDEGVNLTEIYTDLAENQALFDDSIDFPQGVVYFEIEGSETDITIYYHGLETIYNPSFQKFGPTTPGDISTIGWYTMPNVTFGTATIGGKTVVTAQYHLKDGELGDNTGVDGRIVDPGGITTSTNR